MRSTICRPDTHTTRTQHSTEVSRARAELEGEEIISQRSTIRPSIHELSIDHIPKTNIPYLSPTFVSTSNSSPTCQPTYLPHTSFSQRPKSDLVRQKHLRAQSTGTNTTTRYSAPHHGDEDKKKRRATHIDTTKQERTQQNGRRWMDGTKNPKKRPTYINAYSAEQSGAGPEQN